MLIKVCGLKYPDNIQQVLKLKPDFAGFNFYLNSPRRVNEETLVALKEIKFGDAKKTAVFVNEDSAMMLSIAEEYNFQFIQLHGNESAEKVKKLRRYFPVIKAIGIDTKEDIEYANEYEGCCDYLLLDKKSSSFGGTGISFNWQLIEHYTCSLPFLLGGGISPENIFKIKSIQHPKFAGVDLNSGFEDSPGLKNIDKLKAALHHDVQC